MKGEHVTRQKRGIWDSIWNDMMVETTYMKFGRGPGEIIGVVKQPQTVKVWQRVNKSKISC